MSVLRIYIGNRNYSSWSLRGWLALKHTGMRFEEKLIALDLPETGAAIRAHSPSGRVPVLEHGSLTVWESLAIAEYLAETYPGARLWPESAAARAVARAVSAEMHAGFASLRTHMPMDVRGRYPGRGRGPGVDEDIERIIRIWSDCRSRFGADGPLLFGAFSIADAMFAPVVSRFLTYEVDLPPPAAAYRDAVWKLPTVQEWAAAAAAEPWTIEQPLP